MLPQAKTCEAQGTPALMPCAAEIDLTYTPSWLVEIRRTQQHAGRITLLPHVDGMIKSKDSHLKLPRCRHQQAQFAVEKCFGCEPDGWVGWSREGSINVRDDVAVPGLAINTTTTRHSLVPHLTWKSRSLGWKSTSVKMTNIRLIMCTSAFYVLSPAI